ncbi:MAG TPA: carboxypeptidase-like regulatory domain-containing protein [Candidatus Atribacteria bacterium]|nr:carboxypeptidase-like regulatory domain-containing protein [Candidatus Atribacteria bacterium]
MSGCALFSPAPPTKAILKGRVVVPEGVGGQALAGATVRVKDLEGNIVATTTTDANGYYRVEVPPGGPYIIEAVKGNLKVLRVSPQVEAGKTYDLKTADATSTAVALVFQARVEAGEDPAEIDLDELAEDPKIKKELAQAVEEALAAGEDPTTAPEVIHLVDVIMTPPAPKPTPKPTPKPDTTPPTLESLTAYLKDDGTRAATLVGGQWTLEWTVGETVDYIVATASEPVRLVEEANAVVTMSGGSIPEGTEYGKIRVDKDDPTKLIITPNEGNETAGLEGTFTFTVAAGVVEDLAGNPNAEISVILKVTVKIIKRVFGISTNGWIDQLHFWVEGNTFAKAPDGFRFSHDLTDEYAEWNVNSWQSFLSVDKKYARAWGDPVWPAEMTTDAENSKFHWTMYFPDIGEDFTFYIGAGVDEESGREITLFFEVKYTASTGGWSSAGKTYDSVQFPIPETIE